MSHLNRRHFLGSTVAAGAALLGGLGRLTQAQTLSAAAELTPGLPAGLGSYVTMATLLGKKPLIQLADRPPNYESPLEYLRTPITPNDEFFIRYHLSDIPEIDAKTYKIAVGGDGANHQAEINFDDLKKMPAVEVVAVNQCSGNRRGLSTPHVAGVQWGYGAMGCARWKGPRLKDILDKVGVKAEAIEVGLNGADGPAVDKTPDFIKSIPLWKAMDENTIVAYEMNGQPLPHLNGFPARLIVPGWTGTYWMKHLTNIDVLTKPQGGFWMNPAYRIPVGRFPVRDRFITQENAISTPITEMVVNSLITSHRDGDKVKPGKVTVNGMAWDGGYGIRTVEVSTDGGKTWTTASLGRDRGRYAFRPWSFVLTAKKGKNTVTVNATNRIGQSQTAELIFNPAGYHNNVMQDITLNG
ncbi:oxidase [Bradyrhizobium sp. NAS80.1]|uniref:molybdopterin-dependent oxidoreductase n=1 Tax=Bradyrhizobium sp. NAS80.1 TaxID=1680159 RepID=UPI00095B541A|nr:molybdopterin-dependent oxidoreductase [Bradyrhizobium sp. NAS80.1]OKO70051.1 oxidase [Bradyrhizobium sp. NAS80.1]